MSLPATRAPRKPRLAITMGDPAGVGPEIIIKAFAAEELASFCCPVVYGDLGVLARAVRLLGHELELVEVSEQASFEPEPPGAEGAATSAIRVVPRSRLRLEEVPFGALSEAGSRAMADYVRGAALRVRDGGADAVVTCPITKEGLKLAGEPFPGHTEMLATLCGGARVVMMLAGERLKVALVTIHVALRRALELLDAPLIEETIRTTDRFFRTYLACAAPRIAVAGLNPHAGEGGLFGDEEARLIAPAIAACRSSGIDVLGPFPPDTVFHRAYHGQFDVVVAMTHDHGLIRLKLVHFDDGVNVTMGLPILRTSVDHGTAYDIAGTGKAKPTSLLAALRMAARMASLRAAEPEPRDARDPGH